MTWSTKFDKIILDKRIEVRIMTTPQEQRKQQEIDFYTRYYTQLVGAKITGFELVQDEYDEHTMWPTYTAKKGKDTFTIEVSQDPEGNGEGFLFGLPDVVAKEVTN